MVSLLLVLSIFVSSGVLWELRDTVITMVNEPLCGIEEHEHTDECYEKVLVCGLEENEEHTHTEECYKNVLVCGHENHFHKLQCYTDEELPDNDKLNEVDEIEDTYAISNVIDEEVLAANLPMIKLNNDIRALANEDDLPPTIETIDNIAEGIKFTLFDYGDYNLESQTNHYGYESDNNGGYTHPNANTTNGINAGRNIYDDILFFAYGTPPPHGAATGYYLKSTKTDPYTDSNGHPVNNGNYIDKNGNYIEWNGKTGAEDNRIPLYYPGTHDKNSYTGDYNVNSYQSGNRPFQGIVVNELVDGYPKVNNVVDGKNHGSSLAYLFDDNPSEYKTVYTGVNHLLKIDEETGHFVYNSDKNYAYFDTDTRNFSVYDSTFEIVNDNHHHAGESTKYDTNGNPIIYPTDLDTGFKIGFFPFDQYDPEKKDPNFDTSSGTYNHHFGMKMEANFANPAYDEQNVQEPIAFKYSGDDDMWVFVDGKLVLDIGGIHEPTGGMIDFSNGLVWVQDNSEGRTLAQVKADRGYTNAQWEALPKPIGIDTASTSSDAVNKWIVKDITYFISDWYSGGNANGNHEIKMFYLERGGCYSNLAMEMNLPTLKPLTVMKNVDYQQHLVKDDQIDNKEYNFQVWEWKDNNWIKPSDFENNGAFSLPNGGRKTFDGLGQSRQFKVVEEGVDPNTFDQVTINGGTPILLTGSAAVNVESSEEPVALSETNSYTFTNRVIEKTTDIKIKKAWSGNVPTDFGTVKYKIMRTDSVTGEVKQVALLESEIDNDQPILVKRRTFTIPASNWTEGVTKTGLLSQYGNHFYTYNVEELNVPTGYKASYSVDANGDLVITNTDMSKTDINVEKKWENYNANDISVKVKLTRSRIGYTESTHTNLKINILDEGGNLIKEFTTNEVYAGGSAEIAYTLPDGVEIYRGDPLYPQKKIGTYAAVNLPLNIICGLHGTEGHTHTDACYRDDNKINETLFVKFEEDEEILVVQNLSASANTVTFKVTSDKAEDSLLLLHHSFTRGVNDWKPNGSVEIKSSGNNPYAKGDAMYVTGRSKSWHGVRFDLDPAKFKANKTYTFSAYLLSPVATRFKMTFNNGLGQFRQISDPPVSVEANTWTQVTGTIKLPEEIDPYNMYIVVETVPYGDDYDNAPIEPGGTSFRMDEFTAIEGNRPVSVSPQIMEGNTIIDPGGVVTISGEPVSSTSTNNSEVYYTNFSEETDDWSLNDYEPNNDPAIVSREYDGKNHFYYLEISNRNATNDGIKMEVPFLQKGHTYRFEAKVQGDGPGSSEDIQLSIDLIGGNSNDDRFKTIGTANISPVTNSDNSIDYWVQNTFSQTFTIPDYADTSKMYIYFETPYANSGGQRGPFRVNEVRITDVSTVNSITYAPATEPKEGYKIVNGQYVSDFSNYRITLDSNSVTNPVNLSDTGYQNDEEFSKIVTLNSLNSWKYHWQNHDISDSDEHYIDEDHSRYLYKYHIEEISIIKSDNTEIPIRYDSATKEWVSDDENFIVSYSNNDVASNTVSTPILITNKYIWYKLPATGGCGTDRIYFFGIVFTSIGIISGAALYRRKRRRV